tara:strand:+ start:2423 stop:4195 length:1773 start_codon:yes stop_codon:yes gene_type:complete
VSILPRCIGLLQVDSTIGDLAGNSIRLEKLAEIAQTNGADMVVCTELGICGYPPRDLLQQPDFINMSFERAKSLQVGIPMLVGTPVPSEDERSLPANGVVRSGPLKAQPNGENTNRIVAKKQLLPSYDVFDETRYFQASTRSGLCRSIGEMNLGVTICEDAWQAAGLTPLSYGQDPIENLAEWGRQGVSLDATVNLSASPYHADKVSSRIKVCRTAAEILGHPFLLANQVGGNDDLLFDGCSLVAWPNGKVVVAPAWKEGVLLVDLDEPDNCRWLPMGEDSLSIGNDHLKHIASNSDGHEESADLIEDITDAVITGLADYCRKSGIKTIVLGLSGGIDSAVAACVAAAAVGPENVLGIAMPSRFSSQHSLTDAQHTAESLGIEYKVESIDDMHSVLEGQIENVLQDGNPVASENIQSRLRGIIVMAHANAEGRMAIATGNKSELAQGYCTLYGDMAGGYTPLGDLYKMQVYALAEVFNNRAKALGKPTPVNDSTMTKPPSAELAPGQKDEDSLPPYEILDEILRLHIEHTMDADDIVAEGFKRNTVLDVLSRLERNEHKRWQMSPAPRVTSKAFGQGWRRPLASRHDWRD